MYVKYQTTIHNDKPDKCTEPKFRDFLVQSPLLVSMIVFLSNCSMYVVGRKECSTKYGNEFYS